MSWKIYFGIAVLMVYGGSLLALRVHEDWLPPPELALARESLIESMRQAELEALRRKPDPPGFTAIPRRSWPRPEYPPSPNWDTESLELDQFVTVQDYCVGLGGGISEQVDSLRRELGFPWLAKVDSAGQRTLTATDEPLWLFGEISGSEETTVLPPDTVAWFLFAPFWALLIDQEVLYTDFQSNLDALGYVPDLTAVATLDRLYGPIEYYISPNADVVEVEWGARESRYRYSTGVTESDHEWGGVWSPAPIGEYETSDAPVGEPAQRAETLFFVLIPDAIRAFAAPSVASAPPPSLLEQVDHQLWMRGVTPSPKTRAAVEAIVLNAAALTSLEEIAHFPRCRTLRLTGPATAATRSVSLTPLTQLTHLRSLALPPGWLVDLREVAALPGLEELRIHGNVRGSLAELAPLRELQVLELDYQGREGTRGGLTDVALAHHPRLHRLIIQRHQVERVAGLDQLRALRVLELDSNALRHAPNLAQLPELVILDLSHNQLTALPDLRQNRQLEVLYVVHNAIRSLAGLERCLELRTIDASSNRITHCPDFRLPQLSSLALEGNPIRRLPDLAGCPELTYVRVANTPVAGALTPAETAAFEARGVSLQTFSYWSDTDE